MTATLTRAVTWRRLLLLAVMALTASLAVSFTAPQQAHAITSSRIVPSSLVGWVSVRENRICSADFPASICGSTSHMAWRWSGSAWSAVSIAGGTHVFAYPYAGTWHWIWTQRTGWLAIQTHNLEATHARQVF